MKSLISLIIPCYNEEENIEYIYEEINKIEQIFYTNYDIRFEIYFIDDGSKDNTLKNIEALSKSKENVKYITFSRNFGKEAAIFAGLENVTGDFVALMDADMQDPPSLLLEMYDVLKNEDYDCVASRRVDRKGEPVIRSYCARMFYKLINKISETEIVDGARDFRLMTKEVKDAILSITEKNRFSKGIFSWVGFKTKWLEYENIERVKGETKWSCFKLGVYAVDGIVAFSTKPLMFSSIMGLLFCFISFLIIILIMVRKIMFGDPVLGWTSLICVITLVAGLQMFFIGIAGMYLSKTYIETKNRPIYIQRKSAL